VTGLGGVGMITDAVDGAGMCAGAGAGALAALLLHSKSNVAVRAKFSSR
jgi:hypothetical protein